MFDTQQNQPLDRRHNFVHQSEATRRQRTLGRRIIAVSLVGINLAAADKSPSDEANQVVSGEYVQDILKSECLNPTQADLLSLQEKVGLSLGAANPANPDVSAGDKIYVTVPAELCQPKTS